MRSAPFRPDGASIRFIDVPGTTAFDSDVPAPRLYLHGLGATAAHYYSEAVAHPLLAGHRSLLMDLPGHGASDAPSDFGYTLEEHADAVAAVLPDGVYDVIGHSMGGAVAIQLAARHPERVRRLIAVDANLDPYSGPPRPGSSGITAYTEEEFVHGGRDEVLRRVGPHWASTMRLADPVGLYRTAIALVKGPVPTTREQFMAAAHPRTFVYPAADGGFDGEEELRLSGVDVTAVPDAGHNIMLDNVDAFAEVVAKALG